MTDIGGATRVPRTGWASVWILVRHHRASMAMLAAISLIGAFLEAGFLVLLTNTILSVAAGKDVVGPLLGLELTFPIALGVAASLVIVRLGIAYGGVRLSAGLVARVTREERSRLASAFLGASWAVQMNEPAGRLQELMTSFVSRVTTAVTSVTAAVSSALSLVAFLGTGLFMNPLITGGALAVLSLLGAVLGPLRTRVRRLSAELSESNLAFANSVAELGGLGQEMHAFGAQNTFVKQIEHLTARTTNDNRRVQVAAGMLSPVYTSLAYTAVVAAMAGMAVIGVSDLTSVGAVMLLMLRSLSYAQQLLNVSGHLAATIPFLETLEATDSHYRDQRAPGGEVLPTRSVPIVLSGVSFEYSPDRRALANVSATISRGEILGVVGPSGAGKSTLAQLILGLRTPTGGRVTVGGVDLSVVDRTWWARHVSFVPQDPILFTGTVAENIRFFREDISDDRLRVAARQANVLADIEALPRAFDTHLGERGAQLSGGQRQRLSIARALAGKPELLILDEPTSALDGRSEMLIRETMAAIRGEVTVIVIAHRLSTLDLCDRIMVIERGEMTGLATPEALLSTNEFFRRAMTVAGLHPAAPIGETE